MRGAEDMLGTTRRGLFGAPMEGDAALTQQMPAPVPAQAAYAPPSTAKMIIGTLGDTLSQWGGGQGTFLPGLARQKQAAAEAAQYQQRRADDYTDWERKQAYEAAHPTAAKDDAFTLTLRNAGIDPTSPQARSLYLQRAQTLASPAPNFVSDGAGGGRWVQPPAPGMGAQGAPQAPVGKLTPLGGGATPQGARTFPVR
jgi:hypothetical protein